MSADNPTIITPRRNFLIRALGFTAAGATLPISIITADNAKARMEHHQAELVKAWQDYYGPDVRISDHFRPAGTYIDDDGVEYYNNAAFLICTGGGRAK